MKLPGNMSAAELIKLLQVYQYNIERQKGSHIRLTTLFKGQHHITVPNHTPIKTGTLSSILNDVALHVGKSKEAVVTELFGK